MNKNRHFLISVTEWGVDHEPMNLHEVEKLRKDGWELPTLEDYEQAATAQMKGFFDPDDTYWAHSGNGDIVAVVPYDPKDSAVCNRHDVEHRLRLIKRMPAHVITSHHSSKISKAKLIGK